MQHPIVKEIVARMNDDLRESWEERAAILEFDAGYTPELAEAVALLLLLKQDSLRAALLLS